MNRDDMSALEEAERERDALREENRKAHNDLTWRAASMAWATDGRLSTALVHNAEWVRRIEAERDAAVERAESAERRIAAVEAEALVWEMSPRGQMAPTRGVGQIIRAALHPVAETEREVNSRTTS